MEEKEFKEILEKQNKDASKIILKGNLKNFMYGKMDWQKVFIDAFNSRRSSWWKLGHIQEWRNATDEVCFAVWKQLEEFIDSQSKANQTIGRNAVTKE